MFGLFKKVKLQETYAEAEQMYKNFSKIMNDGLASQADNLKKYEETKDMVWYNKTKESMEENLKFASEVKEVRENVIRLMEREAHTSTENRFQTVRDWY